MPLADLIAEGERVMTVCNACRYCEQYCPVFPAMEHRLVFAKGDLTYLANLCHNCGECLYACQYAPPHEFGINVPRTLAQIRALSYEEYCWPGGLAVAFRRHSVLTALGLAGALMAIMFASTLGLNADAIRTPPGGGDFYAVISHDVMTALFGAVGLFVVAAFWIGVTRFWRDLRRGRDASSVTIAAVGVALRDVLTLRHLHGAGVDCTSSEEERAPWRRWCHHATYYGFALCFASTSVAAAYHLIFGWRAPYAMTSLPVVLGTAGGVGLLVGPSGLLLLKRRRDPALGDPARQGLDESFIALLLLASLTGLVLLVLRDRQVMAALLVVHLGAVMALFLTLPYGKFVHGIYRTAALLNDAMETPPGRA